jgi:hypothetical protein
MNQDPTPLFNILSEEIHASEAHTQSGAIKTIISGKRGVGLINLDRDIAKKIEKYNLKIIPIRMTSPNTIRSIVYRDEDKDKAFKLYNIIKKQNGFLTDKTPDEAREIGRLLGYNEKSIEEYIHKKYNRKPPIMPDPKDIDLNKLDINEQTIKDFEKQIEKDNDYDGLNKEILYAEDDFKVCAVNGDYIRSKNPGLNFDAFVDGGSHYVTSYPEYKKYIPEDEIWIDDVFLSKAHDLCAIILHERIERYLMKNYGVSYDDAHSDYANPAEEEYRTRGKGGFDHDLQTEIFNKYKDKYESKHKKKKLNENYQFNKIKDLMKRVI